MTDLYWRGGTGNWSDTAHWDTVDGGAGPHAAPTASDNAHFTALSNATAYTVTVDATSTCLDLMFDAAPASSGTITFTGSSNLTASGNVKFLSGMTLTYTGTLFLTGTSKTITCNGTTTASAMGIRPSGTISLADDFTLAAAQIQFVGTAGASFNTNNHALTNGLIQELGTTILTLGSSVVTTGGFSITTNTTLTANTANITVGSGASGNFGWSGANRTFGGSVTINQGNSGANTLDSSVFNNLTINSNGVNTTLNISGTPTVGGVLTITGADTTNQRALIQSDTVGTTRTISAGLAPVLTNVDFMDVTAAVGTNLILQSQTFNSATWIKASGAMVVTADQTTAPNGTLTADYLAETAVSSTHILVQDVTKAASAIQYTLSVYLKQKERTWAFLQVGDGTFSNGSNAWFDLANGVVGTINHTQFTTAFTSVTSSISPAPNGFYRCSITFTTNSATTVESVIGTATADTTINYLGVVSNGIYAWGAQLQTGSNAGLYNVTTTTASSPGAWSGTIMGDCLGNTGITFTPAATQYWKTTTTGTKSWSTAANWFLATNGGGGAGRVPLPQDDVVFDVNSIGAASTTINQDCIRMGHNVTWTAVTNNPVFTPGDSREILYGSMTLCSGMTLSGGTQPVTWKGRTSCTVTSSGQTWNSFNLNGFGGTLTLQDAFHIAGTTPTNGTLNTNNFNFTLDSRLQTVGSNFVLNAGSSIILFLCNGQATPFINSGGTFNMGTSTVKFDNSIEGATLVSIACGAITFYNIWLTGSGSGGFKFGAAGNITCNDFKDDVSVAHPVQFLSGNTMTVKNWNVHGKRTALVTLDTTTGSGSFTLATTYSGPLNMSYHSIKNCTGPTGSLAHTSTNVSGNTNWTFV